MPIIKSAQTLVAEAMAEVTTLTAEAVKAQIASGANVQLVDIRDVRELQGTGGAVTGAFHAPRGMLEFWVDPASPYHKALFADETKLFVLFCGLGWRSALACKSLQDMGMTQVAHIEGGVPAMQSAGYAFEARVER